MSGTTVAEVGAREARRLLTETRRKLLAGTATRADHRPALEAMLCLPEEEAGRWFDELRLRFAIVRTMDDH